MPSQSEERADQYALGRSHGYTSGYWAATSDVLALINTFEERLVLKKELYRMVSGLRPVMSELAEADD